MKILLVVSILALTVQSREYHYDKPSVEFSQEDIAHQIPVTAVSQTTTRIIKGNNGKNFEVSMAASKKIFEARLPPKEEVFVVKRIQEPTNAGLGFQSQLLPYSKTYNVYHQQLPGINSTPNSGFYGNFQQSFNNPQQHLNLNTNYYNGNPAVNNAQGRYNQFTENSNYQRQLQQQQQFGTVYQRSQQQQLQQQPQQQYYPQQYEHYLQQPQRNNNLPNSNNLLNDLVNNQKYVSQSEASQLDVYPYKQINGNPRPFTRIITKCDISGQCEPQNAAEGGNGGSDFHHQQVLKQSKAQVSPANDKCQNKFNFQYTGNALTSDAVKAQKGIPIYKGTDLRDRRLFAYNEIVIPQYPHN